MSSPAQPPDKFILFTIKTLVPPHPHLFFFNTLQLNCYYSREESPLKATQVTCHLTIVNANSYQEKFPGIIINASSLEMVTGFDFLVCIGMLMLLTPVVRERGYCLQTAVGGNKGFL